MALDTLNVTDTVFIDSLQASVNIGPDCWGRSREQSVLISVFLQLPKGSLDLPGQSDNVADSIHYGHLAKSVSKLVSDRSNTFAGVRDLADAVTGAAHDLAEHIPCAIRVVAEVSKMILLAAGFSFEVITPKNMTNSVHRSVSASIREIVFSVIIGVNPPERETKQRVITDITFIENMDVKSQIDYPSIVSALAKDVETSSYFTLEKFVMELVRAACLSSEAIHSVTVRAQKASALTFARFSGVQITRQRDVFIHAAT